MNTYFCIFIAVISSLIISGCSNEVESVKGKSDNEEKIDGWTYLFDNNGKRIWVELNIPSSQEFHNQVSEKRNQLIELRKLIDSNVLRYFNNIDFKYDKSNDYEYIYVEESQGIKENSSYLEELVLIESILKSNIVASGNRYNLSQYIGKKTYDIIVKKLDGSYYSITGTYLETSYSDYLFDYLKNDIKKESVDSLIRYSVSYYDYLDEK